MTENEDNINNPVCECGLPKSFRCHESTGNYWDDAKKTKRHGDLMHMKFMAWLYKQRA